MKGCPGNLCIAPPCLLRADDGDEETKKKRQVSCLHPQLLRTTSVARAEKILVWVVAERRYGLRYKNHKSITSDGSMSVQDGYCHGNRLRNRYTSDSTVDTTT